MLDRRLHRSGWARLAKFPPGDAAIPDLLARFAALPIAFAPLFGHRSWLNARLLRISAIRALERRTVAGVLRIGDDGRILGRVASQDVV